MNKYLFLDIDGVLNNTTRYPNGRHGTDWILVQRLNKIIEATNPKIVVSSAWRWDVLNGNMTLKGLETMLMRQGLDCQERVVGVTDKDDTADSRGALISRWLSKNAVKPYDYLILDDGAEWLLVGNDHGIRDAGHGKHFVQTDSWRGLTDEDVEDAIKILQPPPIKTYHPFIRSH